MAFYCAGVKVVYDGVGKAVFEGSLGALCKRGHFISFGDASGSIGPVDLALLASKCLSMMRTSLFAYASSSDEFRSRTNTPHPTYLCNSDGKGL